MHKVGIMLALVMGVCLVAIASFSLSQAWLATTYRRSKHQTVSNSALLCLPHKLPQVLIQLPVYNEKYVIERLLRSVAELDYPKDLLSIQLLDDSTDETALIAGRVLKELAATGHHFNHIRRWNRVAYKAGALSYGLEQDNSEFVAVFDADFLPQRDFIKNILCHFADPKIGMVQTRWAHVNANYSLLTKLMALGIDNHFSVEQGGRQAAGCMINFNGTAGMWRRQAIDQAGGWSADCLTEDLDLSFRAQIHGWKFKFVEDILTPSELPVELSAIRGQQHRWTKGAVETSRKNLALLWQADRNLREKLVGTFHMVNSSIFLPLFVFGVAFWALGFVPGTGIEQLAWYMHVPLLISVLALFFTYWVSQRATQTGTAAKPPLIVFVDVALFIVMTTGFSLANAIAVVEGLVGKITPFERTPKFNVKGKAAQSSLTNTYRHITLPLAFYGELICAAAFTFSAVYSARIGRAAFIDIDLFFAVGFGLMTYFTLKEVSVSTLIASAQPSKRLSASTTAKYPAE